MPKNIETFEADLARVNDLTEKTSEDFEEFTRYVDRILTEVALTEPNIFMPLFTRLAQDYVYRVDNYIETGKSDVLSQDGIWERLDSITTPHSSYLLR